MRAGFPLHSGSAIGVGAWQDGHVILQRWGPGVGHDELFEVPESQVVLLGERPLGLHQGVEDSTEPFRFRQWLFCAVGTLEKAGAVRDRMWDELPEFLQGAVKGPTWEETVFARFLTELRELGRIEDPSLDAATAAECLRKCAHAVAQTSLDVGITRKPGFALVASNGRMLIASRSGEQSLSYSMLEGRGECVRHELRDDARDGEALVRDHRRRRSVVVTSAPLEGWVSVPDGSTLSVDRKLTASLR